MQNKKNIPKMVLTAAIILLLIALILYFYNISANIKNVTGGKLMMSTLVTQSIYDKSEKKSQELLDLSFDELADFENDFSMYIDESEISLINKNAGEKAVEISERTYNLLKECVKYSEMSDGRFDITIAPVTLAWGINTDNPQIPSKEKLDELTRLVNYKDIIFDDANKSVMLKNKGMMIDLGAIAKGAACDVVAGYYNEYDLHGSTLSIGGNVLAKGSPSKEKEYFSVGIRNPRGDQNSLLGVLNITDKIISTSGDYERYFMDNGTRYHHIFDTKTASPAQTDLISVSIVTDNGTYAEFLSTYLFVMGKDYLFDILENKTNSDYEFIAVDSDLNVYISDNLVDIFTPNEKLSGFNFKGGADE